MLKSSQKDFIKRHIGPSEADQQKMLNELGFDSLDDLISKTVPEKILFFFEIFFSFLSALYSEFGSPISKSPLRRIFYGTVSFIKSSRFL